MGWQIICTLLKYLYNHLGCWVVYTHHLDMWHHSTIMTNKTGCLQWSRKSQFQQEQLECLRSEIPPDAPWLPILVIHISSKVKTRQTYKFWKIAKSLSFKMLQETLHMTHILKLLSNMYKYEMNPTRTVGATERTRDAERMDGQTDGQTDGWMDRQTDGVKPIYPQPIRGSGGIISWTQEDVRLLGQSCSNEATFTSELH